MSWLAHFVSWWNWSLAHGDAMTTEYLYKGETTSRMQIVKYRDYSLLKWFSTQVTFYCHHFYQNFIMSKWINSYDCNKIYLTMSIYFTHQQTFKITPPITYLVIDISFVPCFIVIDFVIAAQYNHSHGHKIYNVIISKFSFSSHFSYFDFF